MTDFRIQGTDMSIVCAWSGSIGISLLFWDLVDIVLKRKVGKAVYV